ncbi:metalloendopeptidase OMA1, mitochondrial-like isoform X2 [Symsagittifera roscoffensis]|uniref:metalloendopeptidase OMA1, mitochondrial-like isoform X2 n=1 Tax=Symsagittifera roscoffensis TaxID=84072 RepID=UPI00307CC07C
MITLFARVTCRQRKPSFQIKSSHVLHEPIGVQQTRHFHPIIYSALSFGGRISAALLGRSMRKKLSKLPELEQKQKKKSLLKFFGILSGALVCGMSVSYLKHRDRVLFTGRKRSVTVGEKQMREIADLTEKAILDQYEGKVLSAKSQIHRVVELAAAKVLRANRDLEAVSNIPWKLTVVHSPTKNAFVLPNGHIFVFTGFITEFVQNEHQLAFVLAHEIAHVLLKHSAEKNSQLSWKLLFDVAVTLLAFVGLGEWSASLLSIMASYFYELALDQPYSRLMENEADEVGLMLIAKACYDIREACAMWKLVSMKVQVEDFGGGKEKGSFLSTHPSFETRANNLGLAMERANHIRAGRHCAPLQSPDPVQSVERVKQELDKLGPVAPGTKVKILQDEVPGRKAIKLYQV